MISPSAVFKSYNLGKRIFTSNCHIRLLTPKLISPSFLCAPFTALNSQDKIELPEKPKKPLVPFFKFLQERKPDVIKEHPQFKLTEVVKKCSEDWKNVHASVKQRYENEYKDDMAIYAQKYLEYSMKLSDEQKEYIKEQGQEKRENAKKRRARKKLRTLNKPKKPPTAFLMYLMEHQGSEQVHYKDLMKNMAARWNLLDENQKMPYVEKSELAKTKYRKELDAWETKMLQEGNVDVVRVKTLKEKRPVSLKKRVAAKSAKKTGKKTKKPRGSKTLKGKNSEKAETTSDKKKKTVEE